MRGFMRLLALVALVPILALSISCTKDVPTVPDFEEENISTHVWDYDHVLWFDLAYIDLSKGIASVSIWMSAKGQDANAALRIGTQDIDFTNVESYTKGKIYYGGVTNLNTDQPVSYTITNAGTTYEGSITALPNKIQVSTWPSFTETINYSALWTISPAPKFHVIEANAEGSSTHYNLVRQIEGTKTDFTLLQTFWAPLIPVTDFSFGINAINYEMKHENKVLIVGRTSNVYAWSASKTENPVSRLGSAKVFDMIMNDLKK